MDCIFCKIANGEIPSNTIYEDEDARVILDINPAAAGHALVLPKKHYPSMLEYPAEELGKIYAIAQKVGQAAEKELHADGANIFANCRPAAGQTVDHFHVHIIPRYQDNHEKDGLKILQEPIEAVDFDEIRETLKKGME